MRAYFAHWPALARRFQKAEEWLLMFDYDWALTAGALRPTKDRLSKAVRGKLEQLTLRDKCSVAVVSGRSLSDVRQKVGLKRVIYIGNHGLEIESNGWGFEHPDAPEAEREIHKLKRLIQKVVTTIPGARLEDKRWSLAIHLFRVKPAMIPSLKTKLLKCLESAAFARRRFLFQFDRTMLNITPNLHWNKGSAAHWLKHVMPRQTLMFYAGGGPTDEDAFRALTRDGVTLRMGKHNHSAASYYVNRQSDVSRVLGQLIALGRPARA